MILSLAAVAVLTLFLLASNRLTTIVRRTLSISLYVALFLLVVGLLPLWLLLASTLDCTVDVVRSRASPKHFRLRLLMARTVLFFALYLGCEIAGVVAASALWIAFLGRVETSHERYLELHYALQRWWGGTVGRAGLGLFGVRLEIEDETRFPSQRPDPDRPVLLFIRHASVADTILALLLLTVRHGYRLRYVLKKTLLWDPCLDVVGNRLPNRFALKGTANSEREIAEVGRLAEQLGPKEGVLIYPEGTRFTPERRLQAIRSLERRGLAADAARAEKLEHVLLPRRGGPFALLRTNAASPSPADVLFCAHTGFEGSATFGDLWNGGLLGQTVHVRLWLVPFESIPKDPDLQVEWLFDEWQKVEDHVRAHLPTEAPP